MAQLEAEKAEVATVVTKRRVEKGLEKLIEDNIISIDWDKHNMKIISKQLPKMIWEDVWKEEKETISQYKNAEKITCKLTMDYVKEFLKGKPPFY